MSEPYDFTLAMAVAEVITSVPEERVFNLRLSALGELHGRLRTYEKLGYIPELIDPIAEKKCAMILKATTKQKWKRF